MTCSLSKAQLAEVFRQEGEKRREGDLGCSVIGLEEELKSGPGENKLMLQGFPKVIKLEEKAGDDEGRPEKSGNSRRGGVRRERFLKILPLLQINRLADLIMGVWGKVSSKGPKRLQKGEKGKRRSRRLSSPGRATNDYQGTMISLEAC